MPQSFVLGTAADVDLESEPIPADWILSGTPVASSKKVAKSDDFTSYVMVWDCTPGSFTWHYNKDETLVVVSGEVFITDEKGQERRLGPGDFAFFPGGSSATWRVTSQLRKVAVLRETMPRPLGFAVRAWKGVLRRDRAGWQIPTYEHDISTGRPRGSEELRAKSCRRWMLKGQSITSRSCRKCWTCVGRDSVVSKRVVKSCSSGSRSSMRGFRTDDVVLLEGVRCSGAEHDGCQKACMIFWREAWLRKAERRRAASRPSIWMRAQQLRERLHTKTGPTTYFCQASELLKATYALSKWDRILKCFSDIRAGNSSTIQMVRNIAIWLFWRIRRVFLGEYARGRQEGHAGSEPRPARWRRRRSEVDGQHSRAR